ncbi:MAG: hypothetical protein LQ344_003613 [Seirophora lacunosa]|nr:MAG: hypothetical protein LQ344_003613 [Seirophora lacunosa]
MTGSEQYIDGGVLETCIIASHPRYDRKHIHAVTVREASSIRELGRPENTAQVHPHLFTPRLADITAGRGADFVLGSATSLNYVEEGSKVKSVSYTRKGSLEQVEINASDIVIAAGPWTTNIFPKAPIKESRNHSIVVRPQKPVSAYVLFPELHPKMPQKRIPPEIYSRPRRHHLLLRAE